MYRCDLSKGEPETVRWRFENAVGKQFNRGRFALTADGHRMVAACNGMSVIDPEAREVERAFPGWKQLDPKK
jgi:hypothetical protein